MTETFIYEGFTVQLYDSLRGVKPVVYVSIDYQPLTYVSNRDVAKRIAIHFIDHIKYVLSRRNDTRNEPDARKQVRHDKPPISH